MVKCSLRRASKLVGISAFILRRLVYEGKIRAAIASPRAAKRPTYSVDLEEVRAVIATLERQS